MTKHIFFPIILTALIIFTLGFVSKKYQQKALSANKTNVESNNPKTVRITIKDREIETEVADTEEERIKGLSQRESMGNYQGMLFIFPQKDVIPTFWMKDMKFPIDIIWVNDGRIVKIDENIDYPKDGSQQNLPVYKPPTPVDFVIEVKAGFSKLNNWKTGDVVKIPENI